MKHQIRILLLVTMIMLIAVTIWIRHESYRSQWAEYTANSLSKSELSERSRFSIPKFAYLDKLESRFVDLRYWSDELGVARYYTCWRTPYSEIALKEHIKHFDYVACSPTPVLIRELKNNLPADWGFDGKARLKVYCPSHQTNEGDYYFCSCIVYNLDASIIYFYDQDQEVPA